MCFDETLIHRCFDETPILMCFETLTHEVVIDFLVGTHQNLILH
jgi:hypothetical protein